MLTPFDTDIWIADGAEVVGAGGFHFPTRMAVIRLTEGRLFVWSPVALTPALRQAVDDLGQVAHIVAPNGLHHLFIAEWQAAYPQARVHAAPGLPARRPDLTFDAVLGADAAPDWAGEMDQVVIATAITTEVVFFHRASGTVLVTDLLQQMPKGFYTGWRAVVARLDGMTGAEPGVPRKFRMAFFGRKDARQAVGRVLGWAARNVVMAHGTPVKGDGAAFLARAFGWMRVSG